MVTNMSEVYGASNLRVEINYQLLYYLNNALNYINYRLLKHIKNIKAAPTCFGSRRNHHQGAKVSA